MGLFHTLQRRWADGQATDDAWRRLALAGAQDGGIVDMPPEGVDYQALTMRARAAAALLRSQGVRPGDVVAYQLPRSLALLEVHLGCLALGAVGLALNDRMPPAEVRYYLQDAAPRLAILPDPSALSQELDRRIPVAALRDLLDDVTDFDVPAEPDDDALACLMYTSGTTGRPKGAMLSHRNLMATLKGLHQTWAWRPTDHLLHALPLFHIHGLVVAQLGALWAGARTTWMSRFDAQTALDHMVRESTTVFMGVPTFYHRLLGLPPQAADLGAMRLFTSGSAALPAADHVAFRARFGHEILERYGMTEVGIVLSNPLDGERRPGAVGFPLPGVQAKITHPDSGADLPAGQVGEIRIHGDSVVRGYLNRPDASQAAMGDGWMHTGDLGRVDDDGYFHVVGRSKELVISGGFNVYPLEVETVLRQAAGVAEAAVAGLPDEDLGEVVIAAVVLEPGAMVTADALRAWCRDHLSAYKCPRHVRVVDALPRNAMGKVQKHRMVQEWAAE